MSFLVFLFAFALAVTALFLAIFLALETVAAILPAKTRSDNAVAVGPVVVIIPAHNEASSIGTTLGNINDQLREGDQVLVVADNCTDDTAEVARGFGARVLERTDPENRGKGYALQFALDALRDTPPEMVVFTDADCQFGPNALSCIVHCAVTLGRPAQALYLMRAPAEASPRLQVSEFAWAFINNVRMRGLQRLFDVTRFTGAGLAVSWDGIKNIHLGSGEIVEDLSLTFDLIRIGQSPVLISDAIVTSEFPTGDDALARQSARWSIGSMRFAFRACISTLIEGVFTKRRALIGAAIDLMIPPLTIFSILLVAVAGIGMLAWPISGDPLPLILALWALMLTGGAIIVGWHRFGREALPPESLGGVLQFVMSKAAVFGAKGRASAKRWTPTRDASREDDQ
ncbi:glycosyltransferase family 2 protein [Hyphococcus lacteus]|uniref:Glycosyltransferase family 2 protein n=1 Tax=Hyphococcus lacteus TaxID=3143536 RepID=A0ABV3Z423_9PROT